MKYFYKIPVKSQIAKELLGFAHSVTRWERYYNFDAALVPPELLFKDPVMARLLNDYTMVAGILRMPENTCYRWHTDTDRRVAVNMLLEDDGGSRCSFADDCSGMSFPITELKYQPNTYYVFDTQELHSVSNFTTPRYLFSVEFFGEDRPMGFEKLQRDLQAIWN
jgi:hypothetical protein